MTIPTSARLPIKLSRRHVRWIYATAGILFVSGIGWLIAHYMLGGHGEFGPTPNPSEPWWLRLHGAAAMGFLIAFGSLLPGHISRAWAARRNYRSGLFLLSLVALLVLTGYALYYAGDEDTRPWISLIHWAIGIGGAVVLPLHIALGRKSKAVSGEHNAYQGLHRLRKSLQPRASAKERKAKAASSRVG